MDPRPEAEPPRDVGKTIMLYLIYLQALIIAIFAYVILRRQKKLKKAKNLPLKIWRLKDQEMEFLQ